MIPGTTSGASRTSCSSIEAMMMLQSALLSVRTM
jgi:hypothetical protein